MMVYQVPHPSAPYPTMLLVRLAWPLSIHGCHVSSMFHGLMARHDHLHTSEHLFLTKTLINAQDEGSAVFFRYQHLRVTYPTHHDLLSQFSVGHSRYVLRKNKS